MGVFRMPTPDMDITATQSRKQSMASFMGRRYSTRVQPTLRSFLETPEQQQLEPSSSEDDRSSIFTSSSHTLSSDDDACLRELTMRGSHDVLPARHSTACCTDASVRQELRKKFNLDDDDDHVAGRHSFARRHSFRRKLEMQAEDRVENLALWEETETTSTTTSPTPTPDRVQPKVTSRNPKSLHRETSSTSRIFLGSGKSLDSLFRKPRKSTSSSFLNGLFSFSTFSFSRRSRKLSTAN